MESLAAIIEQSTDVREVKRAISVQMGLSGLRPAQICQSLQVSPQYVSKWKGVYATEGAEGLAVGYKGSEGYLKEEEQAEIVAWISEHETLTVEAVRDYIETRYGVRYQSKQSYYTFLEAGGLSYHRSEPANPKHEPAQVQARRAELKKNWQRTRRRLSGET